MQRGESLQIGGGGGRGDYRGERKDCDYALLDHLRGGGGGEKRKKACPCSPHLEKGKKKKRRSINSSAPSRVRRAGKKGRGGRLKWRLGQKEKERLGFAGATVLLHLRRREEEREGKGGGEMSSALLPQVGEGGGKNHHFRLAARRPPSRKERGGKEEKRFVHRLE